MCVGVFVVDYFVRFGEYLGFVFVMFGGCVYIDCVVSFGSCRLVVVVWDINVVWSKLFEYVYVFVLYFEIFVVCGDFCFVFYYY